jgi:hypothetical protein
MSTSLSEEARRARDTLNARRRQQRRQKAQIQRDVQFAEVYSGSPSFIPVPAPESSVPRIEVPRVEDRFEQLHLEDGFEDLLPPSPSLVLAPIDLPDIDSGYNVRVEGEESPLQGVGSNDAPNLEYESSAGEAPDLEYKSSAGDAPDLEYKSPAADEPNFEHESLAVKKLASQLTSQLLKFHGCCTECHYQQEETHLAKYTTHHSLQTYTQDTAVRKCPSVLDIVGVASHRDQLANQLTAAEKRWMYSGIHSTSLDEVPEHICLAAGDSPTQTPWVSFDIDSVVGYATSFGVARCGIRWNPVQMEVSDLQAGLHISPVRVQFFDRHGHAHSQLRPIHEVPHCKVGRLVGFEDMSLYILFPRLYREGQQTSRLLDSDFGTFMDQVLLPAIYKHHRSDQN